MRKIVIIYCLLLLSTFLMAQPGPPGDPEAAGATSANVPLDGGAIALLLSGVAYFGRKQIKEKASYLSGLWKK